MALDPLPLTPDGLNRLIVSCERCPRLREWCTRVAVEKRKSYADDVYWGRPVPNFGDPAATGLIVGLAPAAHGGNRTGRMFTGDRSGDWLYAALHAAGLANQPSSTDSADGLQLLGVTVTAVCHCAPPDNKPTPIEIENCRRHLTGTFALRPYSAFLCLGGLAWKETMRQLGLPLSTKFSHGARTDTSDGRVVLGSFHPSQQNTYTGRLTREMLQTVVQMFADTVKSRG
jgi:uracil-DNA glycosylase family 4